MGLGVWDLSMFVFIAGWRFGEIFQKVSRIRGFEDLQLDEDLSP